MLDRLDAGIAALTRSTEWDRYLAFQSRFHHYSPSNVLLIAAQCPHATQVAGYATWRRIGRHVRQGEQAIWILAPMLVRRLAKDDHGSASDHAVETEPALSGFRAVPVFDLSQTDGAAPPELCRVLDGDAPEGLFPRLVEVAEHLGYRVQLDDLPGTANGECHFEQRLLRIEQRNGGAQRVKSLAHELAHAMLHEEEKDRPRAELEAESVAYVTCQALGFDSGAYSFGYVASWAGGGAAATVAIKSSCRRIQHAADTILAMCAHATPDYGDPTTGFVSMTAAARDLRTGHGIGLATKRGAA
jgi:antirestriction protein ArdC